MTLRFFVSKMVRPLRFLLAAQIFVILIAPPAIAASVDWRAEWEKTVSAAKAEGHLAVYAARPYETIFSEFQKKYPEIKVVYVLGRGAPDLLPRILSEQRVGKHIGDLFLAGVTAGFTLNTAGTLAPMRPVLVLPDVVDGTKWWERRLPFVDKEDQYIFAMNGMFRVEAVYNTKLVDPKELKSYWDLLNPKWKGKIVVYRQPLSQLKFYYYHSDLGPEFLKRLFSEMDVTPSGDMRQITDWLALGKFPLAIASPGTDIMAGERQGLPIGIFQPDHFKEGTNLVAASGSAALLKNAPHPNAAKLALNWLLSREGQIVFQKNYAAAEGAADSRRVDIPKDEVRSEYRRRNGVRYLDMERHEFVDPKPITDLMKKSLKTPAR
ncbi:MAG: extracellular solute-binding protein [Deltaproteobacteria bacterium]|nr:extracellular solute-binding protein [Deltaproteobacteria bacterium]